MSTALRTGIPQIERVMLLQSIQLLKFCSVEEVLRIAAIAELVEFAEGEEVYGVNQTAKALYCIVEGLVVLESDEEEDREVGPKETFGVLDILSGRLRRTAARAVQPTAALAIEADDFFDLISNNVEIVKALFRELLDGHERLSKGGLT